METSVNDGSSSCSVASICLDYDHDPGIGTGILMLISGLSWTCAYLVYIHACHTAKAYIGVPVPALLLNLAWEFVFSWIWLDDMGTPQVIVNRIWFAFDCILLAQFVRYQLLLAPVWYTLMALTLWSFLACWILEFHDFNGIYMAFGQNLVMSILFCQELLCNPTRDPIHVTAGAGSLRLVGTAAASLVFFSRIHSSRLLPVLYLSIFVWDVFYITTALWHFYSFNQSLDRGENEVQSEPLPESPAQPMAATIQEPLLDEPSELLQQQVDGSETHN